MSAHSSRLARMLGSLEGTRNGLLAEFRRTWDYSLYGIERFRRTLDSRPEPMSIRDEADDFLADLADAMRNDR